VNEVCCGIQETETLACISELLTPKVVECLPPHFKNIKSISDAQGWYNNMVTESRLFMVKNSGTKRLIGFIFVFVEDGGDAHIGYLLGEAYWGKGYATELLKGLLDFTNHENKITRLIAGVATNNIVSANLLQKLGFVNRQNEKNETIFYEYLLSQT